MLDAPTIAAPLAIADDSAEPAQAAGPPPLGTPVLPAPDSADPRATRERAAGTRGASTANPTALPSVVDAGLTTLGAGVGNSGLKLQNFVRSDVSAGGNVRVYDYQAGTALRIPSAIGFAANGSAFADTTSATGAITLTSPYGDGPADVSVNAWWNTAYRTRRCFTVTNPAARAVQNQPASIVFNAAADLTAGRLAPAASDLRVTTGGASPTALSFYAAGPWTTSTTASTVNVRIPSLAAGASTVVCLYYGNAAAGVSPSAVQFARKFPLYRVNNGGVAVNDTLEPADANRRWQANTANGTTSSGTGPGGTWNLAAAYSYGPATVTALTAGANAIPSDVPTSILQDENYAPWNLAAGCSGTWDYSFAMPANKPVEIRWYSAELFQTAIALRRFHVNVNGVRQLTNFDPFLATGSTTLPLVRKAGMWSWTAGPGGSIAGASPLVLRSTCTGLDSPGVLGVEILDNTTLSVSGPTTSESTLASSGTWTTAALDAGAVGTDIWGTVDTTATLPAGTAVAFQVRWATTRAGLSSAIWRGPDGTAATSYAIGSPVPMPYDADTFRFAQLRYQLTGAGLVGPTVSTVTVVAQLPELVRVAEGQFTTSVAVVAGTPSAQWLVRIRGGDASLAGRPTSIVSPVVGSGGSNLTAAQLRLEDRSGAAWCCGPTQVQVTAGTITAPPPAPTATAPGPDGFRSVRLDVSASAAATTSVVTLVVKYALTATVALEIPLRVQIHT